MQTKHSQIKISENNFGEALSRCSSLSLRLYENCPVGCSHCCISAVPGKSKYTCSFDELKNLINEIFRISKIGRVTFTGPEIVLDDELHIKLGNFISLKLGLPVGILTSGYWAKSEKLIRRYIEFFRRSAVSIVQISYDNFHPLIDKDRLAFLIETLRAEGFFVSVLETCAPKAEPEFDSARIYVDRYEVQSVAQVGRFNEPFEVCESLEDIPVKGCDFGSRIYLESDRNLYMCSGPGCKKSSRAIGRVSRQGNIEWFDWKWGSLSKLYPGKGPRDLYEEGLKALNTTPKSENPCTACWALFD